MTEEQAKTKRCCGPENCGDVGNPDATGYRHRWCNGSACMAWRWFQPGHDPDLGRQFPDLMQSDLNARRDVGYCGRAGKP